MERFITYQIETGAPVGATESRMYDIETAQILYTGQTGPEADGEGPQILICQHIIGLDVAFGDKFTVQSQVKISRNPDKLTDPACREWNVEKIVIPMITGQVWGFDSFIRTEVKTKNTKVQCIVKAHLNLIFSS